MLKVFHKGPVSVELLHQSDDYAVARIKITEKNKTGLTVGKFQKDDLAVLAIERGGKVISSPKDAETLQAGDYLLCYGKTVELDKEAG